MIFKYKEFKKYLEFAKSIGKITPLDKWDGSNAIVLRHDVDFDIDLAYQLALIETECNVRSTFFILTTCNTYNPLSAINRIKLYEMANMGFEIGLHFDPTVYGDVNESQMKTFVDQEAKILFSITGSPVKSVSLHNPSIHGQYPLFEGYNNAYDPRIFSDSSYLSDSRMDFRGKNLYEFVEKVKDRPIQILLHPLHYSDNGLDRYPDIFCNHIKRYTDAIDDSFRVNSTYVEQITSLDLFSYVISQGAR